MNSDVPGFSFYPLRNRIGPRDICGLCLGYNHSAHLNDCKVFAEYKAGFTYQQAVILHRQFEKLGKRFRL